MIKQEIRCFSNFATEPQKEYDPQLEKEREAFLKQLEMNWEE